MNLADVNVLVHALRSDSPDHARCRGWLQNEVRSGAKFAISLQILSGVIRVATHPKICRPPTPLPNAIAFCDTLADAPTAVRIEPGAQHWPIYKQLIRDANAMGNLAQDAWFAALALEHGCTWVTLDRDYSRFKGLRIAEP